MTIQYIYNAVSLSVPARLRGHSPPTAAMLFLRGIHGPKTRWDQTIPI